MPTNEWFKENPKVSAYISSILYQRFEEWMKEKNIKKVSQALTQILEEHLGVVQTELTIQPSIDDDRLESVEANLAALSKKFEEMEAAIAAMQPQTESSLPVVQSDNSQLSILEEPQKKEVVQTELNEAEIWTNRQIEERLKVKRQTLSDWNRRGELPRTINGYTIVRALEKQRIDERLQSAWEVHKEKENQVKAVLD